MVKNNLVFLDIRLNRNHYEAFDLRYLLNDRSKLFNDISPRIVDNFLRIPDGVTAGGIKFHYMNINIDKIFTLENCGVVYLVFMN